MGGTSAIGIEQEDGSVVYMLYYAECDLEYAVNVVFAIDSDEAVKELHEDCDKKTCASVEEFLFGSGYSCEHGDSVWRSVKLRDGRVVGRTIDMDDAKRGVLTYQSNFEYK